MSSASQLNDKQLEAMKYVQGPLLVLAGAGSGKTSVITRKIAFLVQQCGIPAYRITAMTFTNKAAREMKERVGKLLSREEAKGLSVSTFHTFGLNLLRLELKNLPLKANFSILDADDCKRILMDLMQRDNMSGAESKELIAKAMKKISDWKNSIEPGEIRGQRRKPQNPAAGMGEDGGGIEGYCTRNCRPAAASQFAIS